VPLGLHVEGPVLSPLRLGAHPPQHVLTPDALDAEIDQWIRSGEVALVTLAPELDGALALVARLAAAGIVVAAGHTTMSPDDLAAAKAVGLRYVTHLFNAMAPFDHRRPGPIGAALADDDVVVGLICDGMHVDPTAVAMAWKALGPARASLVSDAVAALGLPEGRVRLGEFELVHDETGVRTLDGVLAGSALPLDRAVRNLMAYTRCSLAEAVGTVTSVPTDLLGLKDRGRVAVGARADFTVLDHDGRLVATVIGGTVAHGQL
jgi:N-acetylglucosamine-6-phosphate deacetylase